MADGNDNKDSDDSIERPEGVDSDGESTANADAPTPGHDARGDVAGGSESADVPDEDEAVQPDVADATGVPDRVRADGVEGSTGVATATGGPVSETAGAVRGSGAAAENATGSDGAPELGEDGNDEPVPVDEPDVDVDESPRWPKVILGPDVNGTEVYQVGMRFRNAAMITTESIPHVVVTRAISDLMRKGYHPSEQIGTSWFWLRVPRRRVKDLLHSPFKINEDAPPETVDETDDRSTPFFNSSL